MDTLTQVFEFFLHIDRHLEQVVTQYHTATYGLLFLIVFMETGLVVTPFLPGDSLLFAAGTLAGKGMLDIRTLYLTLLVAPLMGDNVNYWIGRLTGYRIVHSKRVRLIRKEHIDKTHAFFERYGGKTLVMARFVPIVRTMAPFVAGLGAMTYPRFLMFSVLGAFLWVTVCTLAGYYFGSIPLIKENFSIAIITIIALSLMPALIEYVRHKRRVRVG
ncbi:putative membrane protein [bacterium HR15]|uniref:DedA family protein n=1 Tax=uncultured prokaryote TaxID=198431 RepID=H5SN68_9ZZZZ|nr:dedA family protein [uncultured prokaryote]GBC91651.1 putative membrane protein [bacterium HR15]